MTERKKNTQARESYKSASESAYKDDLSNAIKRSIQEEHQNEKHQTEMHMDMLTTEKLVKDLEAELTKNKAKMEKQYKLAAKTKSTSKPLKLRNGG